MPINVQCPNCLAKFSAKDDLAGRSGRCPKCKGPIRIPDAEPTEDEYRLAADEPVNSPSVAATGSSVKSGSQVCPSCGAAMHADAVLCVQCGFHIQHGMRLSAKVNSAPTEMLITPPTGARVVMVLAALFVSLMLWGALGTAIGGGNIAMLASSVIGLPVAVLLMTTAATLDRRFEVSKPTGKPATLVSTRRLGFFTHARHYDLEPFDSVWFVQRPITFGNRSILIIIMALMCVTGCVPGLIFWWMLFTSDDKSVSYATELRGKGKQRVLLFRGGEQVKHTAQELARTIRDATGLELKEEIGLFER